LRKLVRDVDARHVQTREFDGKRLTYIEGWYAIAQANAIFGHAGWDREMVHFERVMERTRSDAIVTCGYMARVRIRVRAGSTEIIREGTGWGSAAASTATAANERALKAAETDATKRALSTFGASFGLSLYDKDHVPIKPRPVFTLFAPDGKMLDDTVSPEAFSTGLRQLIELCKDTHQIDQLSRHNRASLADLRIQAPTLRNTQGVHFADLLLRLMQRRRETLSGASRTGTSSETLRPGADLRGGDDGAGGKDDDHLARDGRVEVDHRGNDGTQHGPGAEAGNATDAGQAETGRDGTGPASEAVAQTRDSAPAHGGAHAKKDAAEQNVPSTATGNDQKLESDPAPHSTSGAEAEGQTRPVTDAAGLEPATLTPTKVPPEISPAPAHLETRMPSSVVDQQPATAPIPSVPSKIDFGFKIDKSKLPLGLERRIRDKAHLRRVAELPCLVCNRQPSHAHHLRFAQRRGLSQKVSDEFVVPLCALHHGDLHRSSSEQEWWARQKIEPVAISAELWASNRIR
jgi:DNA recombination protein Rad52